MLRVYTRHYPPCKEKESHYCRCRCPKWIDGTPVHMAIPFGSLINASKSAFGILSDTLRLELHPFGIRVAVVEPSAIKTPALEKTLVLHRHSAESIH